MDYESDNRISSSVSITQELEKTNAQLGELNERFLGLRDYLAPVMVPEYTKSEGSTEAYPVEEQSGVVEQIRKIQRQIESMSGAMIDVVRRVQL